MNKEFDMFEFFTKFFVKLAIVGIIIWKFVFYLIFLLPFVWIWRRNKIIKYYSLAIIVIGVILLFESINYKVEIKVLEGLFNFSGLIGFDYEWQVKILEYLKNNFDHQFIYFPKVIIIAGFIGLIKVFFTSEKKLRLKDLMFWKRRDKRDVYIGKSTNSKTKSYLTNDEINHHIHVVGTSGYGKSVFLRNIILSKIRNGETIIVLDLKGDYEDIYSIFKASKVRDDAYFFSLSPDLFKYSSTYNILKHGSEIELKDKILGSLELDHYHFRKRVEAFLLTAIGVLLSVQNIKKTDMSLHDLRDILANNSEGKRLISALKNSPLREEIESFLEDKEMIRDLSGLRADLDNVCKAEFGKLLKPGPKAMDFKKIFEEGGACYIHLDAQKFEESSIRVGKMILQDLKTVGSLMLSKKRSQRRPITIVIDEFSNLATPQFIGFLNKARASNIGIIIAHQELSDLTKFGVEIRDQIIGNTSTKVCFLQQVPDSAELIASLSGTKTCIQETHKTEETGRFWKTKKRTGVSSERESEIFIIHPNEIKKLKVGECFRISKYPTNYTEKLKINYIPLSEVSREDVKALLEENFQNIKEDQDISDTKISLIPIEGRV